MAIVENNALTHGLRGKFGKYFVFRSLRGKTVASHAPRKPDPRKQSAAQRKTRTTFREAAAWAMQTLRNPTKKRFYQGLAKELALPNAYTAAVRAYMRNTMETEERKRTATGLPVCKPVIVSIGNGKVLEGKHQQPDREVRTALDKTQIRIPRGITQFRRREIINKTPGDTLRETAEGIRGKPISPGKHAVMSGPTPGLASIRCGETGAIRIVTGLANNVFDDTRILKAYLPYHSNHLYLRIRKEIGITLPP